MDQQLFSETYQRYLDNAQKSSAILSDNYIFEISCSNDLFQSLNFVLKFQTDTPVDVVKQLCDEYHNFLDEKKEEILKIY